MTVNVILLFVVLNLARMILSFTGSQPNNDLEALGVCPYGFFEFRVTKGLPQRKKCTQLAKLWKPLK